MKIETIDIEAHEYYDKTNGNAYFNTDICINYGSENQTRIHIPMQWGYDYLTAARNILNTLKYIDTQEPLWHYCRENKILIRSSLRHGYKYRELKEQDKLAIPLTFA